MVQAVEKESAQEQAAAKKSVAPVGIVVGHTHWDREWYLPFEGFRARLVAMMDDLLDILERDPAYSCFVLDGQTIMLDDYLEVHPGAEGRLRALVAAGRIKIGPWHTSADTFLPDPESLIRNLQIGFWTARRYGSEPLPVGYMPDVFGFAGQMPQLLQHFGLRYAFAWRGFHPDNEGSGFWWESPDGSRVLAFRPPQGYCESALGVINPERFLEEGLPGLLIRHRADAYPHKLMLIGCDHFPTTPRMPWLAAAIAERVGHEVRIGSVEDMAALVEPFGDQLPVLRGEQRDPCLALCPPSVAGTRIPLKQANARIEALLLGMAEPLQALAELAGAGADRDHLRWAWRLLVQNHPHDSLPGCSTDEVHREMFTRFARARVATLDAAQRGARRLSLALDPATRGELGAIGVVGLSGGVGRVALRLHGCEDSLPAFRIVAPDGQEVPYSVLGRGKEHVVYDSIEGSFTTIAKSAYVHFVAPRAWVAARRERRAMPEAFMAPWIDVELELEAPRAGYRILRIEHAGGAEQGTEIAAAEPVTGSELENDHLRVWAEDSGLFVADKTSGRSYGPIYFSHAGEAGDEYTASPVRVPPVLFAPDAAAARIVSGAAGARLELPIHAVVPAELSADRKSRVGETVLHGSMVVRLFSDRVDLQVELVNTARDYDMRLIMRVPDAAKVVSGAPFAHEERLGQPHSDYPNPAQRWIPDFPMRGWIAALDDKGAGGAVFARGLYEADARRGDGGVDLAVTLLRGVGHISRDDLETRSGHLGPAIATPEAQCLGAQSWDLAIATFGAGEDDTLPLRAEQFLRPALVFPVQWSEGTAPAERQLFAGDPLLVVSALKPADSGPGAMLHAHNPTDAQRETEVPGERVRLDETPAAGGGTLGAFAVAAWRIGLE